MFGQNGVIKKVQEANENTKIAQIREQLELAKGPEYIEGNGKYDPDSYFERIEAEGIIGNKGTDVIDNGDGTYEVTTTPGYIFKITLVPSKDNVEDIQIDHIGKVDGPRIKELKVTNKTTNSITVEVETANAEGATYTYYYKKDGEVDWKKAEEIKEKTYTFSGLESNVIYNIKVRVEKDGKAVEKEISTRTGELPEGAVQFSPVEWRNGQASTTITTREEGYTLQYQIGGITERSWTNTISGSVIGNLQHGQIVYGRLFDGRNGSKTADIDVQDLEKPTVVVRIGTITINSIQVSVSSSDEQWGMPNTPTYNYYIKKSTETSYSEAKYSGKNANYTFSDLEQGTEYDIKITTVDKAGNLGSKEEKSVSTVKNIAPIISTTSGMASYNGNSHLITITAIAIDEDGDNLTYKLYWGTSSSNLSIKNTTSAASGIKVTFPEQTSLNNYTTYYWRVDALDNKGGIVSSYGNTRTLCSIATLCTGKKTVSKVCSNCNGIGDAPCGRHLIANYIARADADHEYCDRCGADTYRKTHYSLSSGKYACNCGYKIPKPPGNLYCSTECWWLSCVGNAQGTCPSLRNCSECDGNGSIITTTNCDHGKSSQHYYCNSHKVECNNSQTHN